MYLKSKKKALTLVEMLVVILIIAILIAISSIQYNKFINNSKIQTVEDDLSGWMSDVNQYIEDYGAFKINIADLGITSENEYLAYMYHGDKTKEISDITNDSSSFDSSSPLNILQSYCTNAFAIANPTTDVVYNADTQYIILTTKSKKDPWGQKYKIIINTSAGTIIVASAGLDSLFNINGYKDGNFKDDVILVVKPKE